MGEGVGNFKPGDEIAIVDNGCCNMPPWSLGQGVIVKGVGWRYYNIVFKPSSLIWNVCDGCVVSKADADAVDNKFPMTLPIADLQSRRGSLEYMFRVLLNDRLSAGSRRYLRRVVRLHYQNSDDGLSVTFKRIDE